MPIGNLKLASAIFASAASPTKVLRTLCGMHCPSLCLDTFNNIQRHYLLKAVENVYAREQSGMLQARQQGPPLKLGGDARCDSPGHMAKYSSYSLMDLVNNKILITELIQSNEVKNSNAMELEGLKRGLQTLEDCAIAIKSLTTDRHIQVRKYLREEKPHIKQWFDCWHIAKNVQQKLLKKGQRKGQEGILSWAHSISNHLYWSVASSKGDGEMVIAKWTSILNHVADIHEGHGGKFKKCLHDAISDRDWIQKGSKTHAVLEAVISRKQLLKDVAMISPAEQTASLEAFHKLILYFAPKNTYYFFPAMNARIKLAALHYNENSDRPQATRKDGKPQYRTTYVKWKQGAPVVRPVKAAATFVYVQKVMDEVFRLRGAHPSYPLASGIVAQRPPSLARQASRRSMLCR